MAAFSGALNFARMFLDHGAATNAENEQGETPLHLVSRGGHESRRHVGISRLLLEPRRGRQRTEEEQGHPVTLTAFKGRSDVAQVLLDHGANPGVENNQGETPLHLVSRVEYDSQEDGIVIALLLLGHGVDVNARDKNKITPLHSAAFRGRLEIAQVLLDHDANLDVENDQGENPLHLVSRGEYDSQEDGVVIALLLLGGRGADVHARDKHHDTALHSAAFWGRLGIATALLDHGANPNVENDQGETPLHLVSRGECNPREHGVGIAQLLFESGVDVNAPDKDQNTPLHSASHLGRLEIVRVLLDHGADASSENDQAQTPLHLVSQGGYWLQDDGLGVAELLLERGADINAQDKDHATPLHVACYRGRLDIARVLVDYDAKS
ncbi:ankyrin repeat-containing domain protein [Lactarius hatsudake]|nr:ankyrin repeat-containing domain protein [Lactarius hatsudake]